MRKLSLILCILLVFIFIFTFSACKVKDYGYDIDISYKGTHFRFVPNGKDHYYLALELEDKLARNYFMPMFVNGLPVRSFGHGGFGEHYTNLDFFFLQNLYMPGTIMDKTGGKFIDNVHRDMQIYYCGEVINLIGISPEYPLRNTFDYYVPAEKFDSFQEAFNGGKTSQFGLHKANISYRLNSEDMCEYYYVDNVEAGSKIQNIPPEPERAGYTFGGWYTEKECVNEWDFDNVPTVTNDDGDFVEFALYAKWVKN